MWLVLHKMQNAKKNTDKTPNPKPQTPERKNTDDKKKPPDTRYPAKAHTQTEEKEQVFR